jgi:methyl-accepting chemotaxis protein
MNPRSRRRQYIVDKDFQIGFIFKFCATVILSSFIIGGVVFYFTGNSTTVAIENTKVIVKPTSDFILPVLAMTAAITAVFSSLVLGVIALIISHRIVGPLYRLRKEIEFLKEGDFTKQFQVRNRDNLKDLAKSLGEMSLTLRKRHTELKRRSTQLAQFLKDRNYTISPEDKDRFSQMLEGIDAILNFFKV